MLVIGRKKESFAFFVLHEDRDKQVRDWHLGARCCSLMHMQLSIYVAAAAASLSCSTWWRLARVDLTSPPLPATSVFSTRELRRGPNFRRKVRISSSPLFFSVFSTARYGRYIDSSPFQCLQGIFGRAHLSNRREFSVGFILPTFLTRCQEYMLEIEIRQKQFWKFRRLSIVAFTLCHVKDAIYFSLAFLFLEFYLFIYFFLNFAPF